MAKAINHPVVTQGTLFSGHRCRGLRMNYARYASSPVSLAACFWAFAPGPVLAELSENNQHALEEVVVQASRLDQAQAETGSSVTVITAEEIEMLGFEFVSDVLATVPGVTVNANGAFGGAASVRIRGAASAQTLVLIDGVAVNDPSSPAGGFDFARLDTENIARIEVLRGPQSTLWGTDAIGGVVSITTRAPEAGRGGSAFAEYGSFSTLRGGASLEHANERGDFRLAAVTTSSDGISKADEANGNSEEDGYDSLTLTGKGSLALAGDFRLGLDLLYNDAEFEFDSFDFSAQGSVGDGDELSKTEELSANLTLQGSVLDGRLENLLLVGYSSIERENFSNGVSGFSSDGDRRVLRYQGTLDMNPRNTLAFGLESEETSANGADSSIDGLFGLYEFKPVDSLTLTGGMRVDDHRTFGSETTGRVAAAWNPNQQLTLRSSWGQGFKAPTIFQTTFFCCGASAPNADLQPETSEALDIGVDWRTPGGRGELSLTWFDQDSVNKIDFSFATGGYQNIDQVESRGIEAFAAWQFTDWLNVAANYAWIDAEDGNGAQLLSLPEYSGDITIAISPGGRFSGAILLRYNGEELSLDGSTLDSWTRVDLAGKFEVNEAVELYARVENLLDEHYQQVLGYGTPDLSGHLGLRVRY
jgi:vitamin B12 transporter